MNRRTDYLFYAIAIGIVLMTLGLIIGEAQGQDFVPRTCPFVKVINTDEDVSWVDVRRVTGITLVPDHMYRRGEDWYGYKQGKVVRDGADEVQERWLVVFLGTGIEARYPTRQEAGAAVDNVMTTAGSRGWQ